MHLAEYQTSALVWEEAPAAAASSLGVLPIPDGRVWEVTIIEAGFSKNQRFYPREVLARAAHLFDGVVSDVAAEQSQVFRQRTLERGILDRNVVADSVTFGPIEEQKQIVLDAMKYADKSPWPDPVVLEEDVYAP